MTNLSTWCIYDLIIIRKVVNTFDFWIFVILREDGYIGSQQTTILPNDKLTKMDAGNMILVMRPEVNEYLMEDYFTRHYMNIKVFRYLLLFIIYIIMVCHFHYYRWFMVFCWIAVKAKLVISEINSGPFGHNEVNNYIKLTITSVVISNIFSRS